MYQVLLIEDDDVDREMLVRSLSALPDAYEVAHAADGRSGLSVLEKLDCLDCILLDYRLPDIDGLELLDRLCGSSAAKDHPIIMLTSEGNEAVAVDAMKRGAVDYVSKSDLSPELLSRTIHNAIETFMQKRKQKEAQARLEQMAFKDCLTGLRNRHLFDTDLERYLATARRNESDFCLMLFDLDDFKQVNDEHGHLIGDEALKAVGSRLRTTLRKADSLYRIGGDEFAAIIDTGVTPEGLETLAQRIEAVMNAPIAELGQNLRIGVSIGLAVYPTHGSTACELFKYADKLMYARKRARKAKHAYG